MIKKIENQKNWLIYTSISIHTSISNIKIQNMIVNVCVVEPQIKKPTLKKKLMDECKKMSKILKNIYKENIICFYYLFVSIPIIFVDSYLGYYDNFNEITNNDLITILKFYLLISANIKIGYLVVNVISSINYLTNTTEKLIENGCFIFYSKLIDIIWNFMGYCILYIFLCPNNILSFEIFFNFMFNRFFTWIYLCFSFLIKIIDGWTLITCNNCKSIIVMKDNLIWINILGISIICCIKLMYYFFNCLLDF